MIYLMADIGSIGGGWLSSSLIKRGWTVNAARKTAMLICALCSLADRLRAADVEPLGGGRADRPRGGGASGLVVQSLHDDVRHVSATAVGSVVGIGGMAGAVGGMLIARLVGEILERTGQLCAHLHHCRVSLPCGITSLSFIVTKARPS